MKLSFFLLPLGAVLLLHWGALNWLSDQAHHIRGPAPLAQLAAPMFTRIVEQTKVREPKVPESPSAMITGKSKPKKVATPLAATVSTNSIDTAITETAAQASVSISDSSPASESKPQATDSISPVRPAMDAPPAEPSPTKDTWPPDTRLTYRLTGNYRGELTGSARVQWQRVPAPPVAAEGATQGVTPTRGYQVRLEMSLSSFVVVSMTSQGQLSDDGLQPQVYEEKLPGNVRRVAFHGTQIRFNNGRVDVRPTTVQDTASQFVELSQRFATGRESLKAGAEVRLWLARPGGLDFWTYDVLAPEILQTPELGAIEAFHLKPRPLANPRGPIVAEMWFAPSLQFLPVRVRISLGGDNFVDLMVERIEQGDAAPAAPPKEPKPLEPA